MWLHSPFFLKKTFFIYFSRVFLVRQLFFWRFFVNYSKVNLLLFYDFPDKSTISAFFYIILILIKRKNLVEKIKATINCLNSWQKIVKKIIDELIKKLSFDLLSPLLFVVIWRVFFLGCARKLRAQPLISSFVVVVVIMTSSCHWQLSLSHWDLSRSHWYRDETQINSG